MKILFIITSLGSGGAERVMSLLANKFSENNEVIIMTLSTDKIFYKLDRKIKTKQLNLYKPTNSVFEKLTNNFKRINCIKKEIENINPDIVISFMTQTNILSIIASKLLNKPIIISERTNYDFLKSKVWRSLRKVIYRFSDGLVVQSNYDKQKYQFVKNVKVIFNPLEVKNIKNKRENIILAVGRLDYPKGFDRLIKIYSQLKTEWPLIIVGDGSERENLESLIRQLNLKNRVFLVGRKQNIEEYYSKAKIFTLSSRMEGFPNVLAEAMGYGCACISFDCLTGPSDIIENNQNGFLIENNNKNEYLKKLQILVDNQEIKEKFGINGTNIIYKLNINKISNEWIDFIKEIKCVE